MDFPITDLMDEDACYAKLVAWLHPDGLACPRCRGRDRMARPPPQPRPGPRLPLRPLPAGLQRLHRDGPAGHQAAARRAGPDPPRLRPGRPHRPAGPRAGLRPHGVARTCATGCRTRPSGTGTGCRWRTGSLEADEAYQNAGEKRRAAHRPATTRRGGGRTRPAATAPGTTTGRRSAGWSGRESGAGPAVGRPSTPTARR